MKPGQRMIKAHGSIEAAIMAGIREGLTRQQIAERYGSTVSNIRNMAKRRGITSFEHDVVTKKKSVKGETLIKAKRDVDEIDAAHIAVMSSRIERYTPSHPMFQQKVAEVLAGRIVA